MLERTIRAVGARPDAMHYFFAGVFPAAAAVRLLRRGARAEKSDMAPVSPAVNALLTGLCGLETAVMRWNRLAGLSVVARVTKP
jgi:hypothetical protein